MSDVIAPNQSPPPQRLALKAVAVFDFFLSTFGIPHLIVGATAGFFCLVLIMLVPSVPRLIGSPSLLRSVQAVHLNPTPRVGGIAVFAALALGSLFIPVDVSLTYTKFIIATGILFTVGLVEDLGFGVSPMKRLLAAFVASFLAILLSGIWLPRIGIPSLDWIMGYWAIGIPLTLLVTAGVANAMNLIDGVNGLAAFTAMVAATAMAAIASQAGYDAMTTWCMLLAACVFGFFVFNFPFGKIFLGDAGAYTLGFILSWFAIAILIKSPQVSPWALMLTLFWPIADTFLAIYRRFLKKSNTMSPDRLHFHQLVMRSLEIHVLGRDKRHISNPLSTVLLAPFVTAPAMIGVMFWDSNRASFFSVVCFGILFFGTYVLVIVGLKERNRNPSV